MLSAITVLSGAKAIGATYPDLNLRDPKQKDAQFIAQYGQAHVSDYMSSGKLDWWGNTEFADYLAYAQGRQDTMQYKRHQKDNRRLDKKESAMDYRILKIVPKYIKSVSGLLDQAEFVATAEPIDALAESQKQEFIAKMRAQMEAGPQLAQMGIDFTPPGQQAALDEDDLQMKVLQYKNAEAARMEGRIADGLYDADYPQLARELNQDNIIFKRSCLVITTNKKNVLPQRVEPWRLFLLPSRYEDYRDLKAGAFLDTVSVGQIREEAGNTLDEGDYVRIASEARISRGQTWTQFRGDLSLMGAVNSVTVDVIRFGFMSLNRSPDGVHYWTWYEGNLIVGTNLYFNCREAYNQLYDMESPGTVRPAFLPMAPDQVAGVSVGVLETVMTPADAAQRKWLKIQDTLNRAVPSGYAYDLDRIEEVVLSENNKLSKEQVIEMFERSGRWVHNGVTIDGSPTGNIGLQALPNGIPPDVPVLYDLMLKDIDLIERMSAINAAVAGGNAESRVAVGGLELAKEGSVNALKFLFSAQQSLFERCCRVMAIHYRQQEILNKGTESGFGAHLFRMKVEQLPTREEKMRFQSTVDNAVKAGVVDMVDALMIQTIKNPRMGIIVLAARARRKKADEAAKAKADMEGNAKQQQQSAITAQEEIRKTNAELHQQQRQLMLDKEDAITKRDVLLKQIQVQADVALKYYDTLGKLHATALDAQWKGVLATIPKPTDMQGGSSTRKATSTATQAATLAALMPAADEGTTAVAEELESGPEPAMPGLGELGGEPPVSEGAPAAELAMQPVAQ